MDMHSMSFVFWIERINDFVVADAEIAQGNHIFA